MPYGLEGRRLGPTNYESRGERRWLVRVYRGADAATGKRRYQSKTVHGSKQDAQRLLTKMLRARDATLPARAGGEAAVGLSLIPQAHPDEG